MQLYAEKDFFTLGVQVHKSEKKWHAPQSLFLAEAVFFTGS